MYFLMIRPQQRRAKQHQEMVSNLKRGDVVVLSSGAATRNVWGGRWEGCSAVYREGETFGFYRKDRLDKGVYRRVSGNPEGY